MFPLLFEHEFEILRLTYTSFIIFLKNKSNKGYEIG